MGRYQVPGEEAKGCDFMGVQFHVGGAMKMCRIW